MSPIEASICATFSPRSCPVMQRAIDRALTMSSRFRRSSRHSPTKSPFCTVRAAGHRDELVGHRQIAPALIGVDHTRPSGRRDDERDEQRQTGERADHASRRACHSPLPNWLRLTMPLLVSLAAPSSTVPAIAPSLTRPSKR